MAIRTAVALSDQRSLQRRAVTGARPAFLLGQRFTARWGASRWMDPAGFVCAGFARRSKLTGLRVIIQCLESRRAFSLFSAVRSLRGLCLLWEDSRQEVQLDL